MQLPRIRNGNPLILSNTPSVSDDPCTCCESGGGPHGPYTNCISCLADVRGIAVSASGYKDILCARTYPNQTVEYRNYGATLNRVWALTELVFDYGTIKSFMLTLGTPGQCNGVGLGGTHTETFGTEICDIFRYLDWIQCSISCSGGSLLFGGFNASYSSCTFGTICPFGGGASFGVEGQAIGSAPFIGPCNAGTPAAYQGTVDYSQLGLCPEGIFEVQLEFSPIW